MKSMLAFSLPLYLSCAPHSLPPPVVEDIEPSRIRIEEERIIPEKELPFRQVNRFVTESFRQILRQEKSESLGGILHFEENGASVEYNYNTATFCDLDTHLEYHGKLTLEYSRIEGIKEYMITTITLTDVYPFGSADTIGFRIDYTQDGQTQTPKHRFYNVNSKAQAFYESLIRKIGEELELHQARYDHWKYFQLNKVTDDKGAKIEQSYTAVIKMLKEMILSP